MSEEKYEIMALLPKSGEVRPDNPIDRLISIDALKTADLNNLTLIERVNIRFVVCKISLDSLKTRDEPHFSRTILSYGEYNTFNEALNYYIHKVSAKDLRLP